MTLDSKEDQTAPISQREVQEAILSNDNQAKLHIINRIINSLNEKRDAYNGIVSSIIYVHDSEDLQLCEALKDGLIESITNQPMRFGGKMFINKALSRLTSERPVFVEELFEQMVEMAHCWSKNFQERHEILRLQIIAIKAIRQAEQSRGGRPTTLSTDKIDHLCAEAVFNCDDYTKIDTLCLILESRSTTKPLEDRELNSFKGLFYEAINLQEPSLRQMFIALTGKMIRRMKDSHRVVMRDKTKYSDQQREHINLKYMQFLTWLIEFCFARIYCNAYFGSFIVTISTLKLIIEHITFADNDLPIEPLFGNIRRYDCALSCLNDSFEENKALALDLLFSLPYNEQFYCEDNLITFEKIAYQLVASVNPAHSLTCQYVFKLIVGLRSRQHGSTMSKNQLLYRYLSELLVIVEDGVKETQEDFVSSLKHKPIYPKLTCIRALLDEIDIDDLDCNRDGWVQLARRIVISSIDACQAVSTIVCNLNPETIGHLPMDLKPVDADTLSKTLKVSLKISDSKLNTITSQMLLISGWKTIKECSLSLGSMCVHFWWPKEPVKMARKEKFPSSNIEPILDSSDITKIIEFFNHYLRNLRHRGAFEQAYNGFMMVTRRIWREELFRNLLVATLHQIMDDFKDSTNDDAKKVECLKAYVTRRSAGLPFIVQAILNSEHKHDSKTLRWVMDCLFDVLESENSEVYQRIHCLNILKALVKEHFLGEKVLSYVGRTFSITMESFTSDSFPIRNCANMLLKATVDRTFGVNRLRNDIHRRNQLSFERFFTECPNLHSKMLQLLDVGLKNKSYLAAVHGVFIVLFRLKPSLNPSNEFSADKIIKPFIEPILKLAYHCPEYRLRELAAKLAVQLESFCTDDQGLSCYASYQNHLSDIILKESQTKDRNQFHGALLLLKNLVEISSLDANQQSDFLSFVQQVVIKVCLSERHSLCSSLKTAALDVAESYCLSRPNDSEWLVQLYSIVSQDGFLDETEFPEPHHESLIFKYTTVVLMGAFPSDHSSQVDPVAVTVSKSPLSHGLDRIVDLIPEIVTREPNRTLSVNLQASLLRFLRQLLSKSEDFVDKLLDKLDLDPTSAHVTPFDRLKQKSENDCEKERLAKYCQQDGLRQYMRQLIPMSQIFDLVKYKEFKPINNDENGRLKFSARFSNTPRSVELLALICKNWNEFELEKYSVWQDEREKRIDKLNFMSQFICGLPDCDIKCLALLCAGNLLAAEIKHFDGQMDREDEFRARSKIDILENFTKLLDDLADGDHSLTIRETCCEVLRMNLKDLVQKNFKPLQGCLVNLFSASIKLSQDEEHEVRLSCERVILSLRDRIIDHNAQEEEDCDSTATSGSHLDYIIKLATTQLFDPQIPQEINNCFGLLMRIIFNHAKNYSNDVGEEKERLFDKTKLNTFADHVATIECSLRGLQTFFNRRRGRDQDHKSPPELIDLNALSLPRDILVELKIVDSPTDENTGDYSWRLKKVIESSSNFKTEERESISQATTTSMDNNKIADEFFENVLKSLDYFSKGYCNMLTDTEYTYRELSLFKRMAFVKFVLHSTTYQPKNEHLVSEIKKALEIAGSSCSTTLLYRCRNLIT